MAELENNMEINIEESNFWDSSQDTQIIQPKEVVCFSESRSCSDLFRMVKEKQLKPHPKYQRNSVWTDEMQTLFIDSLYKRLPIPSLCISNSNEEYEVIDGQQRILSIIRFLNEEDWQLSDLEEIDENLRGKKVSEIKRDNIKVFERIQNTVLPLNMVNCDYSNDKHMEYIIKIFSRLNSGGVKLSDQEMRNCLFSGALNDAIIELGNKKDVRETLQIDAQDKSFAAQEMVLIFFAFQDNKIDFTTKLKTFLDQYMIVNRNRDENWIENKKKLFMKTISWLSHIQNLNVKKSYIHPTMYGIGKNIDVLDEKTINDKYNVLMRDPLFAANQFIGGTWARNKVSERFDKAEKVFANAE